MQDRFRVRTWYTNYDGTQEMLYNTQATYDFMRGTYHHADFQEVLDDKNCINMQCTGLKDCNGKLIYEGDIVRFYSLYGHATFEIKRSEEFATFGYEDNETDFSEFGRLYDEAAFVEVIGNIYENKEWLKNA